MAKQADKMPEGDGKVVPLRQEQQRSPELSDEALIAACALGDESALVHLFNRHQVFVHRVVTRMLAQHRDRAEDLVQATFLEVWRCAPRFRRKSTARTFIIGIAINVTRNELRSEHRRRRAIERLSDEPEHRSVTPEDATLLRQRVAALESAIDALSPKLREVFILSDLEGLCGAEVADTLDIRTSTVWRRLHDARKQLRAAVREVKS